MDGKLVLLFLSGGRVGAFILPDKGDISVHSSTLPGVW
jgi:hypothetical protein